MTGAPGLPGFDARYTDIGDYLQRSTRDIWDTGDVGLIYSHYTSNVVVYGAFETLYAREALVHATLQRSVELPTRFGAATQVIWNGNDIMVSARPI